MINKLKKALDNQESIKSTILMYGENDFFEEEVFILGDNPLICIPKDELKYLQEANNENTADMSSTEKKYKEGMSTSIIALEKSPVPLPSLV